MARFDVRLTTPLPPDEAWRRVWNLDAHSRVIPLTRLTGDGTDGTGLHRGARFVARTGIGPLVVDDVMHVTHFDTPTTIARTRRGRAHVDKQGRVVRGAIDADVRDAPTGGSTLHWRQTITLLGVPTVLDPIVGLVARAAYGHVLHRLLRD